MDPFNKENKTPASTTNAVTNPAVTAPASETVVPTAPAIPTVPVASTTVAPVLGKPAEASPAVQTGHVEKSNKLLYLFIGLLLVILLGLIGLFFYNQLSDATAAENSIEIPTTIPVTPTVVIPTYASEEEKEVMGVEVGAVESQLNIIEQDVNKL